MKPIIISQKKAGELVKSYAGSEFFSVSFIKRTTGELRKMNCRKGVKKHLKGGSLPYSPSKKNLVPVWDATIEDNSKAYRMISVEGIREVKMNGKHYQVK